MAIRDKIISGGNGINFTKETDSSSDWSGITNSTYFRDVTDGLIHYKNSTGTVLEIFSGVIANVPQANKIYVDSLNGTDSTGRGKITSPYLTVEYALADITNTGTVTATTTNLSATLTAVSSTANIVVGQYITGTGIPYNTTVVSKTSNTIVLSQACTAGATITATWWTIYEFILNGNFVATGSWWKQGCHIINNDNVSFGAITLINVGSDIPLIPYKFINNGYIQGTTSTSKFYYENTQFVLNTQDHYCYLNVGNLDSLTTNYVIDIRRYDNSGTYFGKYKIEGKYLNAPLGYAINYNYINVADLILSCYGLLGGVSVQASVYNSYGDLKSGGYALTANAGSRGSHNGSISGNISLGNIAVNGYIIMLTTGTLGGASTLSSISLGGGTLTMNGNSPYTSGNCIGTAYNGTINTNGGYGMLNIADAKSVTFDLTNGGNFIVNGGTPNYNVNNRFTVPQGLLIINGFHYCYGANYLNLSGTGRIINNGYIQFNSNQAQSGGEFLNNGYMFMASYLNLTGGVFRNNGVMKKDYTAATVVNSYSFLINGGTLVNKGLIEGNTLSTTIPLITKTSGKFINHATGFLKVANGKGPISCTANTSASKDVQYFGGSSNCDGSTYGMKIAFDGSTFTPNDIVGGALYENTTFGE